MAQIRGRFAPSPSGRMHLGNLFTALLAWLSVRAEGGVLVLRMEDLDPDRCQMEYAAQLVDDLRWLGLDWDEGYGVGGAFGPYQQSRRSGHYESAFCRLQAQGLVYPCFCSRAERLAASAPHRSDGAAVYPGTCSGLSEAQRTLLAQSRRPAFRIRVPDQPVAIRDGCCGTYMENLKLDCGDFILKRSDGVFAYQLAVVADDGEMAVNQVVRGRDLLDSTPRQCYLYQLLGLCPPSFYHVPLLLAQDGRRLSKRDRDLDMGVLRARFTPHALIGRLAYLAGLQDSPEPAPAQAFIPCFSWEKVPGENITVPSDLFSPV